MLGSFFVENTTSRTVSAPLFVSLCAPSGPFGKAREVARAELRLATRMPHGHLPREHEHPLLVAVLVVIGAVAIALFQLVDGRAKAF